MGMLLVASRLEGMLLVASLLEDMHLGVDRQGNREEACHLEEDKRLEGALRLGAYLQGNQEGAYRLEGKLQEEGRQGSLEEERQDNHPNEQVLYKSEYNIQQKENQGLFFFFYF